MRSLSPAALKAMFSPEADDSLMILLSITGEGLSAPIYLANNYTERLSETETDIVYGVRSRLKEFVFLPLQITLPSEEDAAPRASLTIHDVTKQLMPAIRTLLTPPTVLLELVLKSAPDVVETSFPGFVLGNIHYTAQTITGELTVKSLANEPFPAHSFTPSYFRGLF